MDTFGSYAQNELSGMSQTEVESRALIRTASRLNQIKENWSNDKESLNEALEKNRRLWSILASAMKEDDCPQPIEIKQNIVNLANFIFKRTMDILISPAPEKLDVLITINMNIARGLSGSAE